MTAAAKNLVPLTLELGGKSPVIIGGEADLADAAVKIMDFKLSNAGQTCISPGLSAGAGTASGCDDPGHPRRGGKSSSPHCWEIRTTPPSSTAATSSVSAAKVDDALGAGVKWWTSTRPGSPFANQPEGQHKMMPRLFINPDDERLIMKEEILARCCRSRPTARWGEAIDYVNRHDRPLALYYFGPASGPGGGESVGADHLRRRGHQ